MEDNVQRIFSILLAVLMFFLLPLYIAFEKKDDIAYNLALKVTTNFVNSVTEKGYLTYDMYNDYITELSTTGNVYDIKLEYIAKEYNPVIQVISTDKTNSTDKKVEIEYDYLQKKTEWQYYTLPTLYGADENKEKEIFDGLTLDSNREYEAQLTYKLSEYKYYTDQILSLIENSEEDSNFISEYDYWLRDVDDDISSFPRLYGLRNEGLLVMNEGDQFNVIIKNENTTIATVLFNTLTFGANSGNDTKVYINYGGTIKNQEYMSVLRGDVNDDGIVNQVDMDLIKAYVDGNKSLFTTLKQKIAADYNGNGVIDDSDRESLDDLLNG